MPHPNYIPRALLLYLLCSGIVFAGPPKFPPPPESSVEWVGQNINVNGINSSIRAFRSRKSIEKVVEFYRREWQRPPEKGIPGFMETIDNYPWYIISRVEDDYLLTVQVQVEKSDKSSSWGYLSTSPLPGKQKAPKELAKNTPKMAGSHVLSEMKSDDPGKKASTVMLYNTHSLHSNVAFYRNYYNGKGWTMETDKELGSGDIHSLVFKSRRKRVTMMFVKEKSSTRIVINSVTNSIL